MDHPLCQDDLSRLYKKFFSSRAQWYAIGCALGVSGDDLEAIERDHRGKCDDCFRAVLLRWLRKKGNKTESELIKAIKAVKISKKQKNNYFYYTAAFVVLLLSAACVVFASRGYLFEGDPVITAAQNLKELYKNQPVIEFKLLDYATDMPFINVTTEGGKDFWKFLHSIDSKHRKLRTKSTGSNTKLKRLIITGHPGAGKTTLMRYLAKEWANAKVLQSCQILFLIHLDVLPKDIKPLSLSDLLKISPLKDYLNDIERITTQISKSHGAGACFLLDSYDGWHSSGDFVYNLIFKAQLHSSLCVLTSRPFKDTTKQSYVESIQIVGFNSSNLEEYLRTLSTNDGVTDSISDLWKSNHNIKEMCELPLNMVMLIFIAKHDGKLDIRTRTEIYLAFMDTIIKHFNDHHPQWNTVSLRECILNTAVSHGDELCDAFKHLHHVAFKMLFYHEDKFPEYLKINENINKLGVVNITKIKSIRDQVKFTFFHPTFLEFFAAIHLLTLPQEQLLYLYIEEQHQNQRFSEDSNYRLFFFGLMGGHYRSALSQSTTLRQINMYFFSRGISDHPSPRQLGCCYGIFKYIPELANGWTRKKLDELLESAGTVVNSSLCVDGIIGLDELSGLRYTLDYANIHKIKIGAQHRYFIFEDSNHRLDASLLVAASACLNTSGNMTTSLILPSMTHLQFDVWEATPGLIILDCLLKTASNLQYLHIGLEGLDLEALSTSLTSIITWRQNLPILSISVELKCSQLPAVVSKFNKLPSELILKLKINLTVSRKSQLDEYYSCQKAAPLLHVGTLKPPDRLKELTLVLPRSYSLSSQDWILLHQFTVLEHLSISFGDLGTNSDKIVDGLSVLNNLVSLEICHSQLGIENFLKSLPLLMLQKLTLDHDNLTDHDVYLLAKILSKSLYKLESLSLRYNSITGNGVKSLVKALKSHDKFHSLDLSGNPIKKNEGLETLKELITLSVLNLTNSDIGDVEMEVLGNALASNKNLRFLNLSGNPFIGSETGLAPLAKLTSLHQLDITGWSKYNHINKRNETLNSVLKNLTQLRLLNLCSRTDLAIYWSDELASTISHLPKLQLFNAPCLEV